MSTTASATTEQELAWLRSEVERQGRELEALRAERATPPKPAAADEAEPAAEPVSRRGLLKLAGAGAAGAAGAMLAASPAAANDPNDVVLGGPNDAGAGNTRITSTHATSTFDAINSNGGVGSTGLRASAATASGTTGLVADGGTGVLASSNVAGGMGVFALATSASGIAMRAEPTGNNAIGFYVTNPSATATGVIADGAIGVSTQGTSAPIWLHAAVSPGAPASGAHFSGELYVDSLGNLFLCVSGGSPGVWTKLNNQAGPGGGPQLISPPQRVYDSRIGFPDLSPTPQGPLAFGQSRVIDCSPSAPPGATAILFNLTVANTVGSFGALAVFSPAGAEPSTSSINWTSPGSVVGNNALSACDAGRNVTVKCVASAGCSTNFIMDVFAYYL